MIRTHSKQGDKLKLNGEELELEDIKSFTYVGSIATATGGTEEDVKCRIGKAKKVLKSLTISEQFELPHRFPQKPSYESLIPCKSNDSYRYIEQSGKGNN